MKKYLIFVFLFVALCCQGQRIDRSHWTVTPIIKSTSFGGTMLLGYFNYLIHMGSANFIHYSNSGDGYSEEINYPIHNWHFPKIRYMFPLTHVSSPDGASISRPFWWRNLLWGVYSHTFKFSAGYEVSWKSMVSPWGIFAGAEWEYHHLRLTGGNEVGAHYSQAIVPYAGIRYRIGGGDIEKNKKWMPNFEFTGAYVKNFKYHSEHHYDKSALGNGFRGTIGVGFNFKEFYSINLRYEHDFFDHFDQDFTPDDGTTYPFEGYKTRFGDLYITVAADW